MDGRRMVIINFNDFDDLTYVCMSVPKIDATNKKVDVRGLWDMKEAEAPVRFKVLRDGRVMHLNVRAYGCGCGYTWVWM